TSISNINIYDPPSGLSIPSPTPHQTKNPYILTFQSINLIRLLSFFKSQTSTVKSHSHALDQIRQTNKQCASANPRPSPVHRTDTGLEPTSLPCPWVVSSHVARSRWMGKSVSSNGSSQVAACRMAPGPPGLGLVTDKIKEGRGRFMFGTDYGGMELESKYSSLKCVFRLEEGTRNDRAHSPHLLTLYDR
ncbi:hypothetical protein ACLOJK_012819, partial [Asimina triloba]